MSPERWRAVAGSQIPGLSGAACRKGPLGLVFPNDAGSVERLGNILERGFHPVQVAASLVEANTKYTGLHSPRHFFASWCFNTLERPSKVVQERLGHSTVARAAAAGITTVRDPEPTFAGAQISAAHCAHRCRQVASSAIEFARDARVGEGTDNAQGFFASGRRDGFVADDHCTQRSPACSPSALARGQSAVAIAKSYAVDQSRINRL